MEPENEAKILCKYLINRNINFQAQELYKKAITIHNFQPDVKDQRLESLAFKHPYFIGFIDGGMALVLKQSTLRKKIFLMLAILETIPEYSDMYLSKEQSFTEFLKMIYFGIRGVIRGIFGLILVKII
jgi:hypothetical protein